MEPAGYEPGVARIAGVNDFGPLYFILEYTGVLLAAIIGGQVAKRMNFDVVGFGFIALISSLAGGMLRDCLLNNGPVAALQTPWYLIIAVLGGAIAFFLHVEGRLWDRVRFYMDVVTVGVWSVVGASKALVNDLPWISVLLLAVITATGGSLVRDVVLRNIPSLFTSQKMLVFPALLAAGLTLAFSHFQVTPWKGMLIASIAASVLSMAVYWVSTRRAPRTRYTERSLEKRLAAELNMSKDDPVVDIAGAIEKAPDEDVINIVRIYLRDQVLERAGSSPAAAEPRG